MMFKIYAFVLLLSVIACDQPKKRTTEPFADSIEKVEKKIEDLSPSKFSKAETKDPILAIHQKVSHINTTTLQKKHFEFICDEKMMLDYLYEKDELKKIAIDFGAVGDVYAREDYYYDKGKLIFVYEYVEGGPACEGCIDTSEYRSYIREGRVIKYLKNQSIEKCRTCNYPTSSKEITLASARKAEEMKAILCR